jgi:DNA end-binding protein Ku
MTPMTHPITTLVSSLEIRMPATERLDGLSRDELYDLAKERGIGRRSSMTKEELYRALAALQDHESEKSEESEESEESGTLDRSTTADRSIWTGHISFGLVAIPVGIYTAVEDRSISFHLLDELDGARIRYRKVNEQTGEEVPRDRIVKGYPVASGQYVTFTDDELSRIPSDSVGAIHVTQFVTPDEIDPMLLDRSYFVAPRDGGAMAYAVLAGAMQSQGRVAVAKVTLRQREHLALLRVAGDLLALETLHWPDEVRIPAFETLDEAHSPSDQAVTMAQQLIEHLSGPFDAGRYRDSYREGLEEAIEAKLAGREIRLAPDEAEPAEIVDLTEVLRRSLDQTGSRKSA